MEETPKLTSSIKKRLVERIKEFSEPLKPLSTDYPVQIKKMEGIKAVVFDVYGTLIISASGDLGVAQKTDNEDAFREALSSAGIESHLNKAFIRGSDLLLSKIQEHHEEQKKQGIDYPEVDIRDIWMKIFESLEKTSLINPKIGDDQLVTAAVEYEIRINPTWPMPGLDTLLEQLDNRNLKLGIVSNAQFYTPLLFEAYLGKTLEDLGFRDDLRYWSYQQQIAKPSVTLYDRIKQRFTEGYDINAGEILYIGNDIRNDIMPASKAGFKTALFAGDKRSLRLREEDESCRNIKPDVVVNNLLQLPDCL